MGTGTRRTTRLVTAFTVLSTLAIGGAVAANAAESGTPTGPIASVTPTGQSVCAKGSLLFCENFDRLPNGGVKSLKWGLDTKNGAMSVTTAKVATGTQTHRSKVLRIHTKDNGQAFMRVDDLALDGKPLYGRMRMKLAEAPTAPDWAHFTMVEATGSGSTEIVRPVGGQYAPTNKKTMWGVGADGGPTGDWTNWKESAPVKAGTWQCVEWRLDPKGNQMQTWFDGVDNPDLVASTDQHGGEKVPFVLPKITSVKIGWQLYQSGTTPKSFDVWLDDVALADTRIGC
jgi:hypothetical protein